MVSASTETLPLEQQKLHKVSVKSTGTNPREKLPVKSVGVSTERAVIRSVGTDTVKYLVSSVGTETIERRTATSGGTFSTPTRDAGTETRPVHQNSVGTHTLAVECVSRSVCTIPITTSNKQIATEKSHMSNSSTSMYLFVLI